MLAKRIETFEEFQAQPESLRGLYFGTDSGKLQSVIVAQQFSTDFLMYIFKLADIIREIEDIKPGADFLQTLCSNKRVTLLFEQPSTRTRVSFEAACQILGINPILVTDPTTSSQYKGETGLDTVQTLSEYVDLLIIRHSAPGFVENAAWHLSRTRRKIPVINAGSSQDQHPTQALLDVYTMYRKFRKSGGFDGKVITFVGDLRSRTVRSNVYLLRNFPGIKLQFCAPPDHQIEDDIINFLDKHQVDYEIFNVFGKEQIEVSDAIYMTRFQNDYDKNDPDRASRVIAGFTMGLIQLGWLKPDAIVAHPLPRRLELDPACDVDPRIVIWSETRNGLWIRVALEAIIFGVDNVIKNHPDYTAMFNRKV